MIADNGANLGPRDISFTGNTIQQGACESALQAPAGPISGD